MPGPAPTYRPVLAPGEIAACERRLRRPTAPQGRSRAPSWRCCCTPGPTWTAPPPRGTSGGR